MQASAEFAKAFGQLAGADLLYLQIAAGVNVHGAHFCGRVTEPAPKSLSTGSSIMNSSVILRRDGRIGCRVSLPVSRRFWPKTYLARYPQKW